MKCSYHPETDSLYIELSERPSADSQEINQGIVLDLDSKGDLVGLDIDKASERVDLSRLQVAAIPVIDVSPGRPGLDDDSHNLLQEACSLADGMVSSLSILRSSVDQVCAKAVYLVFFVRMVRIFRAFAALIREGLGPEAALLIRPFFDTLVDWGCIESDPENLGEMYAMHQSAYHLQWIRNYGSPADVERYVAMHGDTAKDFCKRYQSGQDKVRDNWIGLQAEEKAAKGGLSNYYKIFRDSSNKLHNSPAALAQYLDASQPGKLNLNTEPDYAGLDKDIVFLCLGLSVCLDRTNEHFGLDSKLQISEFGEQVRLYAELHGMCLDMDQ